MDNRTWIESNTFHHSEFKDLNRLVAAKRRKGLSISLCLPTLNEERTIAKEIVIMKSELMVRYPLLDEIVVIDSGSVDKTRQIARSYGVAVFQADEILPRLENFKGKGENLWKALYVTRGDIVVYIDADIKNIHHRFAYGLLGPLLLSGHIRFTKAFYDRPIAVGQNQLRSTGGGRVTELVIRPLFSLFMPDLTQFVQPLSGEYAGFRGIFDAIPFHIGYGVETGMLIDIHEKWGLDVMAQVDLDICASPVWMYDPSTNDLHLNAIRTQGTREYRLGKGIEKVFNTSFGSVLIRRRVLDAFVMAKEKFTEPSPLISEFQGHELFPPDSVFFAKAAKLGFPVHIDWTCPFATHHKYAQFNTPFVMNFVSKVVSGYARAEGTDSP